MIAAPITVAEPDAQRLVAEMFLKAAGPALVKRVAEILGPRGIPVMPLKGVLLQKLVYGDRSFRAIADVDLLVPERRFFEAFSLLAAAGFSDATLGDGPMAGHADESERPAARDRSSSPSDPHRPLAPDRRRESSRGARPIRSSSALRSILPSAEDLFAHLLLHATLHWLERRQASPPGGLPSASPMRCISTPIDARRTSQIRG